MYSNKKLSKESATNIFKDWDLKKWEIEEINKHFEFNYKG